MKTKLPLYLALLLLTQCSKCKSDDPSPLDQLPPITQTGANTFGCLVNGQPWTPKGNNGTSNYSISYDPGLNGGLFDLQAYRYIPNTSHSQGIALDVLDNCQVGNYTIGNIHRTRAVFDDTKSNCYWSSSDSMTTYHQGTLAITRLDLQAGIIAGTFAFTLYKPDCDTIHVTNGRFDYHL